MSKMNMLVDLGTMKQADIIWVYLILKTFDELGANKTRS